METSRDGKYLICYVTLRRLHKPMKLSGGWRFGEQSRSPDDGKDPAALALGSKDGKDVRLA
jgi:hypothetical protein